MRLLRGTLLLLFAFGAGNAQNADPSLAFEVASVKPAGPAADRGAPKNGGPGSNDSGRLPG